MINLDKQMNEAQDKALDSLSRYKFMQFGYWAAIWVHLNRMRLKPLPNPFRQFVSHARMCREIRTSQDGTAGAGLASPDAQARLLDCREWQEFPR